MNWEKIRQRNIDVEHFQVEFDGIILCRWFSSSTTGIAWYLWQKVSPVGNYFGILKCSPKFRIVPGFFKTTKAHRMLPNCSWKMWKTYSFPFHYNRAETTLLGRLDCRLCKVSAPRKIQSDTESWTSCGSATTQDSQALVWEVQE